MKNIKYIYTTILVLAPVLTIYGPYIHNSLSLFDCLLVVLFPLFLFSFVQNSKRFVYSVLYPYFIYIFSVVLFYILFYVPEPSSVMRTFRYLFYLLYVILFVNNFFDSNIACKLLILVSVFATCFLIIQIVFLSFFGIYISGYVPYLELMREGLEDFGTINMVDRPRSIFVEPASYAAYVSITLICVLFSNIKVKSYIPILLCSGLVMSASTSGIVYLVFIFILYIIINRKRMRMKWQYLFSPIFILILYFLLEQRIDLIIDRINEGKSYDGRMTGYQIIDYLMMCEPAFLFGNGFVRVPDDLFLAGWIRLLFYIGVLGVSIFVFTLLFLFVNSNRFGKILILFLLLSGISGSGVLSASIIYMLAFILINKKNNENFIYNK